MNTAFHYPPELLSLLFDTIPLLCRSKRDVLIFFQGAGVDFSITKDLETRVKANRDTISKYEIVRNVLIRLNEMGDRTLRERREILKRIVYFEDFSTCWPDDQLKAKGLVSEIRRVVKVKDSFTRMHKEREDERKQRLAVRQAELEAKRRRMAELTQIRRDLFSLFAEQDRWKRGKALESALNRLFGASEILIREAFTLKGSEGEGIIEQIDGAVEIDGEVYLVEMKWWNQTLGVGEVSQHLVRLFTRGEQARGIIISYSDYTGAALTVCRDALSRGAIVALCLLKELVDLLEQEGDLKSFLKAKVNAAIIDKNPFYRPLGT